MAPHIEIPGAVTFDPLQAALLRLAICCGDADAARRCLEAGADPNACDAAGQSALALATALGQAQVCAMLLDHGADPPAETGPAASDVVALGQAQACEILLDHGADPPAETPAASVIAMAWAEALPQAAPEAFSDRAYRVAKALLAANPASEGARPSR